MTCLAASATAQTGVNAEIQNPLQIATLHWYNANLTTSFNVAAVTPRLMA